MAVTSIRVAKLAVLCIVALSQLLAVAALPNADPDHVKCKQQGQLYEFEGAGFVRRSSYACDKNPKNLQPGMCILHLHEGIYQCDADSECAGFGITNNGPWHNAFDRPGLVAVQLFSKGSPVLNNTEWGNFVKVAVDTD